MTIELIRLGHARELTQGADTPGPLDDDRRPEFQPVD